MPNKEKLKDMLDNLIDGKPEQAEIAFHDYLNVKMRQVVGNEEVQELTTDGENTKE